MAQFNTSCNSLPDASYKPTVRRNVHAVSSVQAKIAAFKGNLKTQTQELDVPSSPKVNQHNKFSLAQQSLSHRNDGVVDIISTKPPKTQKPNYIRTCGTQNNLQRESTVPVKRLPAVLALGSPPPKPLRPPSVDIHRFGINLKYANDGLGTKIPRPVAPPPLPPRLHRCPSSSHAATLNQQDESYEDGGIMNPPPLPLADDYVKNESVNTGHDDLKEEEETGTRIYQSEAESAIYDDIREPAESFSAATTKHRWR
ncbi:FYN-binding protein 1-like [Anarrhichthys ocellatus]|uniref:FYN-binding protein 1-like n=1 Tax=Anarrhichthys ocellatus TaxID=433405 RepID=UPI0012EE32FB|nr:FYN-binding protein 1-like [Anarrhichthys ocellatus]